MPSSCERYEVIEGSGCVPQGFNRNKTVDCGSYVWDESEFEETVVSEVSICNLNALIFDNSLYCEI